MSNIKIVKKKEANKYFKRNLDFFNSTKSDYRILDLLKTSNIKPKSILEIGCANGIKLNEYQKNLNSKINYGIDLSSEAIKSGKKKLGLFKFLKKKNIHLQVHYTPIHLQPFYMKKFGYKKGDFPIAENFFKNEISLPIYYNLELSKAKKIASMIKNYILK